MKVILTGVTGMVGEGVLIECLQNAAVEKVLVLSRKPLDVSHAKLEVLLVPDFMQLRADEARLAGYDACFYCAGISSNGLSEKVYTQITYTTTMHVARILKAQNPKMVFNFVSGASTDSSGQGRAMWARVKGRTENELRALFTGAQYSFRPGLMKPFPGQKHIYGYNRYIWILAPLLAPFFGSCTLREIGRAMIRVVREGFSKGVLEVKDIKALSKS